MSEKTSVALGLFDGVHRGHRSLIEKTVMLADEKGIRAAALTFLSSKDKEKIYPLHLMKKVVDEVAQGVLDETKNHITWKDKKYSNAFSIKTSFEDKRNKRKTWYVKPPYYRLTHLLEFGHQTRRIRNGKARTDKFEHVKYGDKYLEDNFFEKMEEAMEKCRI